MRTFDDKFQLMMRIFVKQARFCREVLLPFLKQIFPVDAVWIDVAIHLVIPELSIVLTVPKRALGCNRADRFSVKEKIVHHPSSNSGIME
jgi:hypothetical protein